MENQKPVRHLIEHMVALLLRLEQHNVEVEDFMQEGWHSDLISPEELRELRTVCQVADEMPGGFLIYSADDNQRLLYANREVLRIFQCANMREFRLHTGNSFRGLVCQEDLDAVEKSISQQIAASRYDLDYVEYRIRRKDGSTRWVEDYGHLVRNETMGDIFYVFLGDAADKRIRQQIEQRQLLAEALEKANLAVAAKNTFLSNMSHDMRTPLHAIFGFTSLAKSSLGDPDAALSHLEQIETASKKLLDMIAQVLEVSAMSSAAGPAQAECDLCKTLNEIHSFLLPQAQEKQIDFTLDCRGVRHSGIYTDEKQLRQLVLNLANNAVTYTPPGGRVNISVTEGEELADHYAVYRLVVEDTGIGISQEFIGRIFEPFSRERNSTLSGIHSIGLGLTIVKNIVDKMGGTISVDSVEEKGSVFTVTLHFRVQPQSGPPEDALVAGDPPSRRILLVDDNELNREIEAELLEKMGFLIDSAENGQIALDKVSQSAPGDYDLILMDLLMPVMDGWQASAAIRRLPNPTLSSIPIIALSASVYDNDRKKSREAGINVHLAKPMNFPLLLETIEKVTKPRRFH